MKIDWRDPDGRPLRRVTPLSAVRWTAAITLVAVAHAGGAWIALNWSPPTEAAGEPPPAVMIELAPIAVAPEAPPEDIAPGPQMTEAEVEPAPETPEKSVEKPEDMPKPVEQEPIEKLSEKPNAEAVLSPAPEKPKPEPVKKPPPKSKTVEKKKPRDPKKHRAPQTTAPPTSRAQRADTAAAPFASSSQTPSMSGILARRVDGAPQSLQAFPLGRRRHPDRHRRLYDRSLRPRTQFTARAWLRGCRARRRGRLLATPRESGPRATAQYRWRLRHACRSDQVQPMTHSRCKHRVWFASVAALATVATTVAMAQQQLPSAPRHAPPASAQSPSVQQPAGPAATLPNGASSINESYGDWTVDCRIVDRQKQCALSQAQGNKETGQRVYAIELHPPENGKTEGTILMPFGLNLDAGAILKLDDKDLGKGLRFSTCVPQGCLLLVSFPAVATNAMRKAGKLTAASLNLSSGEAVTFNVSLNGFGAALDRLIQLAR